MVSRSVPAVPNMCSRHQFSRNIKTRNGTDLDPFRGTEQQNRERFAMHAGTERKTTERFIERNGMDWNGNGHISTPLASQKPMTSASFMSRRDLQLWSFLKNQKIAPCLPPGPLPAARTPARRHLDENPTLDFVEKSK